MHHTQSRALNEQNGEFAKRSMTDVLYKSNSMVVSHIISPPSRLCGTVGGSIRSVWPLKLEVNKYAPTVTRDGELLAIFHG